MPMSKSASGSFGIRPVVVPSLDVVASARLLPLKSLRDGLDGGAVQLVYLSLDDATPDLLALVPLLSQSERSRVQRTANQEIAIKFVLGRWLLRSALGAVLELAAEGVPLVEGDHGKPDLAPAAPKGVSFNLAHSGSWAVLAMVSGARIGVDLERKRALFDADRLARRILAAREARSYQGLSEPDRQVALLAAWVRKEAVLKALGSGVSGVPASIEDGLDPAGGGNLEVSLGAGQGTHWWCCALSLPPDYLGALALEGDARQVLAWQAQLMPG